MEFYNRQQKAFTLIEIIVVLIILGILASLALSSYFSWIKKSQAAEGFATINSLKAQLVPCLRVHQGNEGVCIPNASVYDASPNYIYIIDHWYCPTSSTCVWDDQNWRIQGIATIGGFILVVSGNADDTQTSCYSLNSPGLC
jgi:prepilin-type N-terminal cleavage/methylation domain-containing protein